MNPPSGAAPQTIAAPQPGAAGPSANAAAAPPGAVQGFFEFSLLGMLATGYFAVVASGYLDWPTAMLTLAGLCLRALMAAGLLEFELSGRWVAALTLLYIGFFSVDYLYVSASFLKATVHLVFFLAVIKLLTAKTDRDYTYIKVIATLELLAAAVLSANVSFFAFLALFLLFAIATFASGEVRRSAQLRETVARGGLRAFPRRLSTLTGFLFTGILLMTAGMFFVLPRSARAALERFVPQRYHLTGFSNVVTLGEIGEIKKSSAQVMHVRSYQGEGLLQVRWRGTALSNFDGRQWSNPPGGDVPLRPENGLLRRPWAAAGPGRPIVYQVHLNEIAADTLFIAGTPENISINVPVLEYTTDGSFHVPRHFSQGGLSYAVYGFLQDETAELRPAPEPLPTEARLELLQLPPIDRRIQRLARELAAGATTDGAEARQIESRLRSDYGYTLDLPSSEVADPLANFLFVRKKGHCEYFASAMAIMLRIMGIPSRVVTGFQSGIYNPMTGWQVVRASDAHSWVEAWINGRGWTTFDPTPFDPAGAREGVTSRLYLYFDAAEQFWQDWVLSYDLDRQIVLAARMDESARRFRFSWLRDQARRFKRAVQSRSAYAPWLFVLAGLGIVAARCGPGIKRRVRGRLRVRRLIRGEGEASDATLLYQRMLVLLERRGIRKPPWLTPAEFVRVLPTPDLAAQVDDLTCAYNEFRFGGKPEVAPHMIRLLDQMEKM